MTGTYKYELDRGSRKYACPACSKRRFVRYVDSETKDILPEQYGRCDRVESCGYHLNPFRDGYAETTLKNGPAGSAYRSQGLSRTTKAQDSALTIPYHSIPLEVLKATLGGYDKNVFLQNLSSRVPFPWPWEELQRVADIYSLGTIFDTKSQKKYLNGAVTFPYFESILQIQAIQIVLYDNCNHRKYINWIDTYLSPVEAAGGVIDFPAAKQKVERIDWVEARRNQSKVNCFFGSQLVRQYPDNPIALVEGPKSAILGTLYFGFPSDHQKNPVWLATGSRDTFNLSRCKILEGREVILFPDLSPGGKTFEAWKSRALEILKDLKGTRFKMYSYFEESASQEHKDRKLDIADFLINFDWKIFRDRHSKTVQEKAPAKITLKGDSLKTNINAHVTSALSAFGYKVEKNQSREFAYTWDKVKANKNDWSKEIQELEDFFIDAILPDGPIKLPPSTSAVWPITNPKQFIKSNLEVANAQNGNPVYLPYLKRVQDLMNYLKVSSNSYSDSNAISH